MYTSCCMCIYILEFTKAHILISSQGAEVLSRLRYYLPSSPSLPLIQAHAFKGQRYTPLPVACMRAA